MKKLIIAILVIILFSCCTHKYYANEAWKAKSSRKELKIKPPKHKHVTKLRNWYM